MRGSAVAVASSAMVIGELAGGAGFRRCRVGFEARFGRRDFATG
jgi:hypothetical protein